MYKQKINYNLESIYIGGGTPLSIGAKNIEKLLSYFTNNYNLLNTEITIEINPVGNDEIINFLKFSKINRISTGIQSFNPKLLETLGRKIIPDNKFLLKLSKIKKNINYDLIFFIPGQNIKMINNDITKILKYNPKHLSYYSLTLKNNLFSKHIENKYTSENHDNMFKHIINYLNNNNYKQYEISSFSQKEKYNSIHNSNYWSGNNYLGIGPGAWGTLNNIRYSNYKNLKKYYSKIKLKKTPISFSEKITFKKKHNEYVFLNLRKNKGLNLIEFKNIFGYNLIDKNRNLILKYKKYFLITNKYINLNILGMLKYNTIVSEFFI